MKKLIVPLLVIIVTSDACDTFYERMQDRRDDSLPAKEYFCANRHCSMYPCAPACYKWFKICLTPRQQDEIRRHNYSKSWLFRVSNCHDNEFYETSGGRK